MAALLITLLLFAIGPISSTDMTKCPWCVQINGSSVYCIRVCLVVSGEESGMLPSGSHPAARRRWVS